MVAICTKFLNSTNGMTRSLCPYKRECLKTFRAVLLSEYGCVRAHTEVGGVGGCLLLDAVPDLDILVAVLRAAVVVHPGRCPGSGIARGSARRCGGVQVWCAGRCPARGGNGPQISMHNYAAAGPTQLVIVGSVSRE